MLRDMFTTEQNSTELYMLSMKLMHLLKIIFLSVINSFIKYLAT